MNSASKYMSTWIAKDQAARQKFIDLYGEDFEKPAGGSFGLNRAEQGAVDAWYKSLLPEILAIQKPGLAKSGLSDIVGDDEPYYGATGGGLSYTFIPTSLGTIITVKEAITGKELNVSDACDWYFYG